MSPMERNSWNNLKLLFPKTIFNIIRKFSKLFDLHMNKHEWENLLFFWENRDEKL